mmetsp:Transcript_69439/g.181982  ORF Transcript_69439/g.181982 Transcript_69439/m.181982 type:complete len:148 (+) Transcript_69439:3-446(+)
MFPVFSFFEAQLIHQHHPGNDIESDPDDEPEPDSASRFSSSEETSAMTRTDRRRKIGVDVALPTSLTVAVCLVAYCLPKVNCVTDLAGNVFMSSVGTLLPGALHIGANHLNGSLTVLGTVIDAMLMAIGAWSMLNGLMDAPRCFMGE